MSDRRQSHVRRLAGVLSHIPILFGLVLIFAALAHRRMLGSPDYTNSPLVTVEVGLVVLLVLSIPLKVIAGVYFVVKKRWKSMLAAVLTAFFCVVALLISMVIDTATLVFGT